MNGFNSENLDDIAKMLTDPNTFKHKYHVIKKPPEMLELWGMNFYEFLPNKYIGRIQAN